MFKATTHTMEVDEDNRIRNEPSSSYLALDPKAITGWGDTMPPSDYSPSRPQAGANQTYLA